MTVFIPNAYCLLCFCFCFSKSVLRVHIHRSLFLAFGSRFNMQSLSLRRCTQCCTTVKTHQESIGRPGLCEFVYIESIIFSVCSAYFLNGLIINSCLNGANIVMSSSQTVHESAIFIVHP